MTRDRDLRSNEVAAWLHSLRPWEAIIHGTYGSTPVGLHAAVTHWKHFAREFGRGMSSAIFWEPNPGRPGYHFHGVLHDLPMKRQELWKLWFERFGRVRIEPIQSKADVIGYCVKYVTKQQCWWELDLKNQKLYEEWEAKSRLAGTASAL